MTSVSSSIYIIIIYILLLYIINTSRNINIINKKIEKNTPLYNNAPFYVWQGGSKQGLIKYTNEYNIYGIVENKPESE